MSLRVGLGVATVRPGQIGGAETYVRGLITGLPALEDVEHLAVLGNEQTAVAYAEETGGKVEHRTLRGMSQGSGPARALRLARALAAPRTVLGAACRDLDVVHFPVWVGAPRPHDTPVVVTMHDAQHHELPQLFSRTQHAYRKVAYDGSARRATLVVTDTESARGEILHHLGLPADQVVAIHHGIDQARFTAEEQDGDSAMRERLGLPERFLYYPANLWPHKDHQTAVRALRELPEDVVLLLSGQKYPAGEATLASVAQEAGVAARVRHLGYVDRGDVPRLYRSATALVFPSLYEGFGYPPLEAMASGCPAVVTTGGATGEVCGKAGVAFTAQDPSSLAEALRGVLAWSPAERAAHVETGQQHAATFTWDATARRHVAAYEMARRG